MKKLLFLVSAVLFGGITLLSLSTCSKHPNKQAREVAEKALMATIDHPESVKIIGISQPDSVFGRHYVTLEEKMTLSVMMMKINERVMKATNNFENFNPDNLELNEQIERQMKAITSLRSLVSYGNSKSDNLGKRPADAPFSGWKVKVEYESPDDKGKMQRSEYWFILDKEAQIVVKSFEVPLL